MADLMIAKPAPRINALEHSLSQILALHLLPGALITVFFSWIAFLTKPWGWPASLALLVTWLVIGIPFELGFLLYLGSKQNGRLSLAGIVLNREPLPLGQYLWLVPALLLWTAITSTLFVPVADGIRKTLFLWWPDWLLLSNFAQNINHYDRPVLWMVVGLSFVLNIAVPTIEEIYFRGYLLPRLAAWKRWAPLASVLLFSLYHFWLPWENPTRILTLLPVVYAVQWKHNVKLSILVHVLLNTLGSIGLLIMVINLK